MAKFDREVHPHTYSSSIRSQRNGCQFFHIECGTPPRLTVAERCPSHSVSEAQVVSYSIGHLRVSRWIGMD